jgi:hypothetical protein
MFLTKIVFPLRNRRPLYRRKQMKFFWRKTIRCLVAMCLATSQTEDLLVWARLCPIQLILPTFSAYGVASLRVSRQRASVSENLLGSGDR